jgi:hypothetical protein
MTSRQIWEALLHKAGIHEPPLKQIRDMVGAVHSSLRNHEGKTIERVNEGMPAQWIVRR